MLTFDEFLAKIANGESVILHFEDGDGSDEPQLWTTDYTWSYHKDGVLYERFDDHYSKPYWDEDFEEWVDPTYIGYGSDEITRLILTIDVAYEQYVALAKTHWTDPATEE